MSYSNQRLARLERKLKLNRGPPKTYERSVLSDEIIIYFLTIRNEYEQIMDGKTDLESKRFTKKDYEEMKAILIGIGYVETMEDESE